MGEVGAGVAFMSGVLVAAYLRNVRKQSPEWRREETRRNTKLGVGYLYFLVVAVVAMTVIAAVRGW